jgi:hypothetical protein
MREALFWPELLVAYALEWGTFAVDGIVSFKDFLLCCVEAIEFWSGLPFIFLGCLVTGEDHSILKLVVFAAHVILSFRSFFIGPNSAQTIYTVSREVVTAFCLLILWCLFDERIKFWKDLPYIFLGCLFTGETFSVVILITFVSHTLFSLRAFLLGPKSAPTIYTTVKDFAVALFMVFLWCLCIEGIKLWSETPFMLVFAIVLYFASFVIDIFLSTFQAGCSGFILYVSAPAIAPTGAKSRQGYYICSINRRPNRQFFKMSKGSCVAYKGEKGNEYHAAFLRLNKAPVYRLRGAKNWRPRVSLLPLFLFILTVFTSISTVSGAPSASSVSSVASSTLSARESHLRLQKNASRAAKNKDRKIKGSKQTGRKAEKKAVRRSNQTDQNKQRRQKRSADGVKLDRT